MKGADVVIVPDNDAVGREHGVAASLLGIAARVRVLTLPNLPEKGDTLDWIASGGTAEQLWARVNEAPEWKRDLVNEAPRKPSEQKDNAQVSACKNKPSQAAVPAGRLLARRNCHPGTLLSAPASARLWGFF